MKKNPCYQTKEIGWPLRILKIPRTLDLNNKQKEWIYEKLAPFGIQFLWKPDEVELRIPVADPYDYFMKVGVEPLNSTELRLTLNKKVPYILDILAFHTLRPVHRETMELFPDTWMKPQNCVSSGAFRLKEWKIQNRMEFEKNPYYWDRHNVKLNRITALPIEDMNTAFSLYEVGLVHIITEVPTTIIPWLTENRSDFHCNPYLGIYFYRCNVTEKPLSNKNFRKALNLAIDKEDIVKHVSKAGERAALSFVPPGFPGYTPAPGPSFNPEEARKYLKLAKEELKDPLDQPIPILYNTNENHKAIAERIQSLWQEHLGLKVELVNKEWKVYLDDQNYLKYKISRSAWIGDYNDPNTFLDLFVTNGTQNRTGWSNKRYDELILELAALEGNPEKRMAYFNEAEQILMEELPIFPLYFYVTKDMVHPRVRNFHPNIRNLIAFKYLSMQEEE
jgi:oligopeptide transport system substrate-binding protein